MKTPGYLIAAAGLAFILVAASAPDARGQAAVKASSLAFVAAGTNTFTFDTSALRGKLRAGGSARGLSDVEHIPTGKRLDRSVGLFGHYRVFTANQRYGAAAWDWPGEAKLQADGSVETRWLATSERPFEMRVTYRWSTASALDVVTTVQAKANLVNFESFLASYFTPSFTNSRAYVAELPGQPGVAGFLAAEPSLGTWLMFPRDDTATAVFRDGRWKLPPNPVEWAAMPHLAKPLGIRRDPATGLTAVIMAPAGDAFALCTPEQTEGHYSMYLSLFGRDLKAGETARARARLVIGTGLADADALKAYAEFARSLGVQ